MIVIYKNYGTYGGGGSGCTFYNSTLCNNNCSVLGRGGGVFEGNLYNCISWGNNYKDFEYDDYYSCGVEYAGTWSITNDPKIKNY